MPNRNGLSRFVLLTLFLATAPYTWGDAAETGAAKAVVNVADFGARGDDDGDDAAAIQQALDSGAAEVVIPKGRYLVSQTLRMNSNTVLTAEPEAIIRLADGAGRNSQSFVLTNRNPGNGNEHITVQGDIWDGNNEHNPRGQDGDAAGYTGTAINFVNVHHLALRGLTVRNPESFSIRLGEVEDFVVEDILLDHTVLRPNQDGIHVGGYSARGLIRTIRALHAGTPNDDMVALNADDDVDRVLNLGMRRGPIHDVVIDGVHAEGAYTFVRLLSQKERLENIEVRNVTGTCRHYALNFNRWRFPAGSGDIRNIRVEHFDVGKAPDAHPGHSLIHTTLMVRDLQITDFKRQDSGSALGTTLLLENEHVNTIQVDDAAPREVTSFSIPEGGFDRLWLNRTP